VPREKESARQVCGRKAGIKQSRPNIFYWRFPNWEIGFTMSDAMSSAVVPLIGCSNAIEKIRLLAQKLAPSSLPVLIQGETGTGKEVVARQLHLNSGRCRSPFVVVDCASISPMLIESELFGYVRGAFTDAERGRSGLLRYAHGGTLFLDEIGELPRVLQSRLLRLIQEREFRPVGATKSIPFDARIIAATNRDLESELAAGTFRADLYFRVNVINVHVPPLRQRREDIPLLLRYFRGRVNLREASLTERLERELKEYDWPGNVRELRNFVESAAIVQDSESGMTRSRAHVPVLSGVTPLAVLERDSIIRALEATKGDRLKAAKLLGIGKTTLYRKLKHFERPS
jgi:transcriptional regulator with PAS, ATPase and Fis domain